MTKIYNLEPINSTQKSFYGKAIVKELRNGSKLLYSYDTLVCGLRPNNEIAHIEYHSQTTAKHINEFLQQNGHDKMSKKEIVAFGEKLPDLTL
ncbi:hypothetical protein [Mammaliicoccus phage vB_MscM-PMS3]|nr:hypothetical protein [Mammaliicoccus phage vB_MscM-PMS3]